MLILWNPHEIRSALLRLPVIHDIILVTIQSPRSVGKAHAPPYGGDEPSDRPEGDFDEQLRIVLRLRRSGRLVPLRGHEPSLRPD